MDWIAPEVPDIPDSFLEVVGVSPFVGALLYRRGFTTVERARAFLYPEEYQPSPPDDLPGVLEGVALVGDAIRSGKKIGVWGDFDVDGQTSTALLVSAFEMLGGDVVYHIPVRETESHGINLPNLKKMLDLGIEVLVTCDTGISAHEAVDYARAHGVKVVVTDHHDLPESLPEADAVINPSMLDEDHPLFTLPGVGVAYKFVEQLFDEWQIKAECDQFLDLVALGIVADVAALKGDTRYLLQRGLQIMRQTSRLGMRVLIESAEVDPAILNEEDIGFSLAPRLNALGRLGDANVIVEFLTTADETRAKVIATQLEGLNAERKLLTSHVYQAAAEQIAENRAFEKMSVIVLKGRNWPVGVTGIVASRIVEQFGKPVVMLSCGGDGVCRGSARSVEGCDITEAISVCADLLDGFGGHPMAAGMALPEGNVEAFRRRLDKSVRIQLDVASPETARQFDLSVEIDALDLLLLGEVEMLSPFGHGNPPVRLAIEAVSLVGKSKIGRTGEHIRLIVEDEGGSQASVLWWRGAEGLLPDGKFNLVVTLKANHFMGGESLQLEYVDAWLTPKQAAAAPKKVVLKVEDLRGKDFQKVAGYFEERDNLLVWGEAVRLAGPALVGRTDLRAANELFIVTMPPSKGVLQEAFQQVQPDKVIFLGLDPKMDELTAFLNRLTGICKYVVKAKGGTAQIDELAGAMAHTRETVKAGLEWLANKGVFAVAYGVDGSVSFAINSPAGEEEADLANLTQNLNVHLGEAQAFRKYLRSLTTEELQQYLIQLGSENG